MTEEPFQVSPDGRFVKLTRKQVEENKKAKSWYEEARKGKAFELEPKLRAALSGFHTYEFIGKKELSPTERTSMLRALTKELAGASGDVASAVFGGITIPVQHVAEVLAGLPSESYIQGILEELEKKIRLQVKDSWKAYLPLAVVAGLMMGAIVLVGLIIK